MPLSRFIKCAAGLVVAASVTAPVAAKAWGGVFIGLPPVVVGPPAYYYPPPAYYPPLYPRLLPATGLHACTRLSAEPGRTGSSRQSTGKRPVERPLRSHVLRRCL